MEKNDKNSLDKLSLDTDTITDIYNTLIYFLNNAEQFAQAKTNGIAFNVIRESEDDEIELYQLNNKKAQKIFDDHYNELRQITIFYEELITKATDKLIKAHREYFNKESKNE